MTVRPSTPIAAARRQLLLDRMAELLTESGAPYPDALATSLLDLVENMGFALPPALAGDVPPPATSTPEGRARAKAMLAETLAARRSPEPA